MLAFEYKDGVFEADPTTVALVHHYDGENETPPTRNQHVIVGVALACVLSLAAIIIAAVNIYHSMPEQMIYMQILFVSDINKRYVQNKTKNILNNPLTLL